MNRLSNAIGNVGNASSLILSPASLPTLPFEDMLNMASGARVCGTKPGEQSTVAGKVWYQNHHIWIGFIALLLVGGFLYGVYSQWIKKTPIGNPSLVGPNTAALAPSLPTTNFQTRLDEAIKAQEAGRARPVRHETPPNPISTPNPASVQNPPSIPIAAPLAPPISNPPAQRVMQDGEYDNNYVYKQAQDREARLDQERLITLEMKVSKLSQTLDRCTTSIRRLEKTLPIELDEEENLPPTRKNTAKMQDLPQTRSKKPIKPLLRKSHDSWSPNTSL